MKIIYNKKYRIMPSRHVMDTCHTLIRYIIILNNSKHYDNNMSNRLNLKLTRIRCFD